MLKSTSLILCLLLASCAVEQKVAQVEMPTINNNRVPSSSVSQESLAQSFEILMNSENPEVEFTNYLTTLKNIFARSEAYMADFDAEINESATKSEEINFEKSKPYKKLLIMRGLNNRMQDKITYFYVKLTDIAYDNGESKSRRSMAKQILKTFKKQLDSENPMEKIAYEDLRNHIANAIKMRRAYGNKSLNISEVPTASFKSDSQRTAMIRENRLKFQTLGRYENYKNIELTHKVEKDAEDIQFVDLQNREPQSEKKYFPSVGSNGNIMGLVFPKGVWALTFDDGPSPIHTANIVKNMDELGIHATFFWLAQNVIQYQSTVDLVKDHGHSRQNHSWSHPQLPKLSDTELDKEITKSTEVESKSYGEDVKYFRCPYGAGNSVPKIRKRIADLGMIHVFWNVDTLDWQDKDPDSIVERAKKQMVTNNHGVVLFHDIHPQSVIASKKLVEWSKTFKGTSNEMRWVTIPEIVKEMNGE